MTDEPAAVLADFVDFKRVATRNAFQIIFEVELEQAEEVIKRLGNPLPGKSIKVGIARVDLSKGREGQSLGEASSGQNGASTTPAVSPPPSPARPRQKWDDMKPSQQAGILCDDPKFIAYLRVFYGPALRAANDDVAQAVRVLCRVQSRSSLDEPPGDAIWRGLVSGFRAQSQYDGHGANR